MKNTIPEKELFPTVRCDNVIDGLERGLASVFDKVKVEIENRGEDDACILIDGWIYLNPVVEIPKERWIKGGFGKKHLVKYTDEQALWAISTARIIPATRNEPEDVDITDIETTHFNEAVHLVFGLIAKNIYNQFCEYESEKEMAELEKTLESF